MFRIQTCCNHILSAAEGFRGQGATCADPGIFVSLFSPQLILQFTEGFQWFYCRENYTYTLPRIQSRSIIFQEGAGVQLFPGGPNANFYRNPRLPPSRNTALRSGSFCNSAFFLQNIHHLNAVSRTISVTGYCKVRKTAKIRNRYN